MLLSFAVDEKTLVATIKVQMQPEARPSSTGKSMLMGTFTGFSDKPIKGNMLKTNGSIYYKKPV